MSQELDDVFGEGRRRNESEGLLDVIYERHRQIEKEGWTQAHDDDHGRGELCLAAVAYALNAARNLSYNPADHGIEILKYWPKNWDMKYWKPSVPRRDLVKAAALIIAEIDRYDRVEIPD